MSGVERHSAGLQGVVGCCVVTAGPTYEPLDEVRRLTNFSTGRLGAELALRLAEAGYPVQLLRGELASWPAPVHCGIEVLTFTTTASLEARLGVVAGGAVGAVFHAAAVSDFRFGRVWRRGADGEMERVQAGKLSTRDGSLLAELEPTPKIITRLRDWFSGAWLVGWKYGVDGTVERLEGEARQQLQACRTDLCVINGPAFGAGFGVVPEGVSGGRCADRDELCRVLIERFEEHRRRVGG